MKFNKLNDAVPAINAKGGGAKIRPFTQIKFYIGQGIMIAAAGYNCRSCELWSKDNEDVGETANPKTWVSVLKSPDFGKFMGESRFKEFCKVIPKIWENSAIKEADQWWEFSSAVEEFNQQWWTLMQPSLWKVVDESMSAWCPRKTKTGGLPNISFILRKPEPLGKVYLLF
jgi:hypothetical protein